MVLGECSSCAQLSSSSLSAQAMTTAATISAATISALLDSVNCQPPCCLLWSSYALGRSSRMSPFLLSCTTSPIVPPSIRNSVTSMPSR